MDKEKRKGTKKKQKKIVIKICTLCLDLADLLLLSIGKKAMKLFEKSFFVCYLLILRLIQEKIRYLHRTDKNCGISY
jgi:hypothetical protein